MRTLRQLGALAACLAGLTIVVALLPARGTAQTADSLYVAYDSGEHPAPINGHQVTDAAKGLIYRIYDNPSGSLNMQNCAAWAKSMGPAFLCAPYVNSPGADRFGAASKWWTLYDRLGNPIVTLTTGFTTPDDPNYDETTCKAMTLGSGGWTCRRGPPSTGTRPGQ